MIKKIIEECQVIGVEVIATICDQGAANRAAINSLLRDTAEYLQTQGIENRYHGFLIKKQEVVPLYDVPHLFKGIRNNLMKYNARFTQNDVIKVAKWEHIEKFYLLDTMDPTRLCVKLTDAHIYAKHMNKMKVSLMTQVFSWNVGSLMKRISQWNIESDCKLPREAEETADLILFLDSLFDSLNGNSRSAPISKPFKAGVTSTSPHKLSWTDAIRLLQSLKFCDHEKSVQVPSVVNLVKTLKGFLYLRSKLVLRMEYFLPRAFNQDCVENFFAAIRSYGRRNVSPNVPHFIASFKSLVVNNYMSSHSPSANCEEDFTTGVLDNLKSFLLNQDLPGVEPLEPAVAVEVPVSAIAYKRSPVASSTVAYFAGYIGKKMIKKTKGCESCNNKLSYSDGNVPMEVIEARQYPGSKLYRPGSYLFFICGQVLSRSLYIIPRHCAKDKLSDFLLTHLMHTLNFNSFNCPSHPNLGKLIVSFLVRCILYFWCKQVNRILTGKDTKFERFLKLTSNLSLVDPIKLHAHNLHLQKCKYKK
ncbi:hypothetical protein PPYR_10859 [Photinus pyralis]|uniref:THAP-type domain-containing protein n=1 Tax=Photinus pyralis TaxID=7054 RepID=A0A5N4AHV1_PHOPY|nr:uncharacterized protein LOC116173491 [Photinus pyralis]KAB0796798.1 hypothetical protein PPYR_10859 [Photinus pyralis]